MAVVVGTQLSVFAADMKHIDVELMLVTEHSKVPVVVAPLVVDLEGELIVLEGVLLVLVVLVAVLRVLEEESDCVVVETGVDEGAVVDFVVVLAVDFPVLLGMFFPVVDESVVFGVALLLKSYFPLVTSYLLQSCKNQIAPKVASSCPQPLLR